MPSIRNRRNGFAQTGPSSSVGAAPSGALVLLSLDGLAAATCARSVESSPSPTASGAAACTLMDLSLMLSRKMHGGTGPRVETMFATSLASVLLALVM